MSTDGSNPRRAASQRRTTIPTFSRVERDRRWGLARHLMEQEGLDALIVYGDREASFPAPFAPDTYFTNDRPGAVVVFPRAGEPISLVAFPMAVADNMQARLRDEAVWIRPENMYAGKMGAAIADMLEERDLGRGVIGIVGLEPYPPFYFDGAIPYNTWRTVLDRFPKVSFKPVQRALFELIATRSAEELDALKWSAQVGEEMCQAMRAATRPGVTEGDVYAAAIDVCPKHAGFTGFLILGSGPEYLSWGPPTWTYRPHAPRVIQKGDVLLAEVFCSFGMLETQHQPTIAVGKVHEDFHKAAAVARESYERGVELLRPGRKFADVVQAMEAPVRKAGGGHVHPWIHGMNPFGTNSGFAGVTPPQGIGRYGRVGQVPLVGGDVVLRPGMTFAVEPNCAFGRRAVNVGGTVVIGENEPIELNRVTTRLMHAA
jgi:Xaa-Pro dipeptidase